jgi:hypothetical protein
MYFTREGCKILFPTLPVGGSHYIALMQIAVIYSEQLRSRERPKELLLLEEEKQPTGWQLRIFIANTILTSL